MPVQRVVIEEFKDTSRPGSTWRLNWFGGIERDPNVATEYKLQVVLTKVKDDARGAWHTEGAVEQDTLRMVPIGVGQLPLLRMGSLWRNGELVLLRSGVEQVFDLDIPAGTPDYYIATDKVGLAGLVPFRDHRLMGYGKNTKCVVLPHNGDPAGIIVPTIELIRFYYANSTRLSKAIFDGDFVHSPSSIYDPDYTGLDGELAVVCRRQDVSDEDCWTIARILNSQAAFHGARRVSDSMTRDFANTRHANPESAFPFSGRTKIKALCKKVGYAPARWLVLSLISCAAPFPYEDLQVIADNDGRQANPDTDIPDQAKIPINRPSNEDGRERKPFQLQSAQEPDSCAQPNRLELSSDSFLALQGKKIKKQDKDLCEYKASQFSTATEPDSASDGTADGTNAEDGIGKTELVRVRPDTLPPSYDLLSELVQELNTRSDISARLLPLPDGPGLITAKRTAPAARRQWAYVDYKRRRVRVFIVLEIVVRKAYFYLVEVERRPESPSDKYSAQIFLSMQSSRITQLQIGVIRDTLSRQEGRVKDQSALQSAGVKLLHKALRHTFSSAKDYATKLCTLLEVPS